MALNCTELLIIQKLIKKRCDCKIVSLGYPDLLIGKDQFLTFFNDIDIKIIKERPNGAEIAKNHSFEEAKYWSPESISFFEALGAELIVMDYHPWTGEEIILDLNQPLPFRYYEKFDIVIDPGTTEHVFNIAQAMSSILLMVKTGGYIYHQTPLFHVNHGFYNFSPIFYANFYEENGAKIIELKKMSVESYKNGLLKRPNLNKYEVVQDIQFPSANSVVAKKLKSQPIFYPLQSSYRDFDRSGLQNYIQRKKIKNIAIFGTANAGEIAYKMCKDLEIKLMCFIDDYKEGTFFERPIVDREDFIKKYAKDIDIVIKGPYQKGLDSKKLSDIKVLSLLDFY